MRRLTKSRENCLRAVLALENGGEGARMTDVAEQLRAGKANACVTVSKKSLLFLRISSKSRCSFCIPHV
jgi:hypothetical protein